jgi:hypothetical protein
MRLNRYLREEDIVKKALDLDEPEIDTKYSDESIIRRTEIIEDAIMAAEKIKDDEAREAIIADLEDKLDKWENVKKETEPAPPTKEEPTEEEPTEEEPTEEEPTEEEPEEEEPEEEEDSEDEPEGEEEEDTEEEESKEEEDDERKKVK